MGVVFDEVEATVAPPANEAPEPEEAEEPGGTSNQPEKFYQLYMEHQRRVKRLWAD
ncbi:MAG: hypothetical protein L6365_05695 [Desulfobulbaceae bacterium]|nr:hypothetical protein [Pseudomonadota bacterium]MCG2747006.1 hypothetical protein [Desulfobulbaceae bacterium]